MVSEGSSQHSHRAPFSRIDTILCILILLALAGLAIFFFVILPQRETARHTVEESTSTESTVTYEEIQLVSSDLLEQIDKNYKSGNYSSIEPYLEQTLAKYDDNYELEISASVETFLTEKQDYPALVKYYERMNNFCSNNNICDDENIAYFAEKLAEARAHE